MSMTYTWEVTGLKNTADGTVVQTYWKKIGTDANGNEGSFAGATPFTNGDPTADGYIPFANLTEADVVGWIQAVVVDDYETHVDAQIQKQIDQLAISDADLPWAEPAPEPAPEPEAE